MHRFLISLIVCCFFSYLLRSQILPKEGGYLNYRIIGFSFPSEQQVTGYKLEIAAGNYNDEDSFKAKIIITVNSASDKIIAEVPAFGAAYTWRAVYITASSKKISGSLHHFITMMNKEVDTNNTRLRIIKPASKYKNSYVFIDMNKALYDMSGKPVWFLPNNTLFRNNRPMQQMKLQPVDPANFQATIPPPLQNGNFPLRDFKLSANATITCLVYGYPHEINYNGDILWTTPKQDKSQIEIENFFHHDFTRLNNGNYMVLGMELILWKENEGTLKDSIISFTDNDKAKRDSITAVYQKRGYDKVGFGTVMEYDKNGNVVWEWKSSGYFAGSDIKYHRASSGEAKDAHLDMHENAFFFDEKNSVIYISFKSISRILKVKYPEGNVLNVYGEIFKPGVPETGNGLFSGQHSCRISEQGYLYLFNNNLYDSACSKIIMMKEPASGEGQLSKVWEYECTLDGYYPQKIYIGGNVMELPDHSIFASATEMFIVSRDKKILWSALSEKWNGTDQRWVAAAPYRAIIISRSELEQLIWNADIKK